MKSLKHIVVTTLALTLCQPVASYAQNNDAGSLAGRSCKDHNDLKGLYKLTKLYEQPNGTLTQKKEQNPFQYIIFAKNGLFFESVREKDFKRYRQAIRQTRKASKDVWQYIIGEKGVIYFYKNQVFSHSVYCAKVTQATEGYRKGSVVLTPTDAAGSQIFQTYERVRPQRKKKATEEKK